MSQSITFMPYTEISGFVSGIGVSIVVTQMQAITCANQASHLSSDEQTLLDQLDGHVLLFQLGGPLSFGVAKILTKQISLFPNYRTLILDLTDVPTVGITATLAIETFVQNAVNHQRFA